MLREPARNIRPKRVEFYGEGLPGYTKRESKGRLIVVEGPDAAGRTVQVNLIQAHLETAGHAVASTGLRRSELISPGILSAKQTLPMGKKTLALFYAADFADQLEHKILPSLHAGFVVLADRYIYTLLARSAVRGISRRWSRDLFGFALKPDLAFCLDVEPLELFHRAFQKGAALDYYESGGDMGVSDDLYESFIRYQRLMAREFASMEKRYNLIKVDGNRPISDVNADLRRMIDEYLDSQQ